MFDRTTWCVCVILCFGLSGCVIFSPESNFVAGEREARALASSKAGDLQSAEEYAYLVRRHIIQLQTQASVLKSTSNLALVGTSGASVGVAAFRASRDLIAGLGVGTAGVLSLQYGTGIAAKQTILDNARLAIDCAIATAEKINSGPATLVAATTPSPLPSPVPSPAPSQGSAGASENPPPSPAPQRFTPDQVKEALGFGDATTKIQEFMNTTGQMHGQLSQLSQAPSHPTLEIPRMFPSQEMAQHAVEQAAQQRAAVLSAQAVTALANSIAADALTSEKQAGEAAAQAITSAAAQAPRFLINTTTMIEDTAIAMLHGAEPGGLDLVSQVKSNFQSELKPATDKVGDSKQTTQQSAADLKSAHKLLTAAQSAPGADGARASAASSAAGAAQEAVAKTTANVDLMSQLLSNAEACSKLEQLAQPSQTH